MHCGSTVCRVQVRIHEPVRTVPCRAGFVLRAYSTGLWHQPVTCWRSPRSVMLPLQIAGRHPLCELLAPGRFIDNDTTLGNSSTPAEPSDSQLDGHTAAAAAAAGHSGGGGGGNSRMLLITGPNASGKSVYMKQVGSGMGQMCSGTFSPEPLRFMPASGCRQPAGS